jgi:hypothetical protein
MTAPAETDTGTVVIRYENQRGALVTVTRSDPRPSRDQGATAHYAAGCAGCLEEQDQAHTWHDGLDRARTWASDHAAHCRALPQPDAQD